MPSTTAPVSVFDSLPPLRKLPHRDSRPRPDRVDPLTGELLPLKKGLRTVTRLPVDQPLWHTEALIAAAGIWGAADQPKFILTTDHLHQSTWKSWHQRQEFPHCYLAAPDYEAAIEQVDNVNKILERCTAAMIKAADELDTTDPPLVIPNWFNVTSPDPSKKLTKAAQRAELKRLADLATMNRYAVVFKEFLQYLNLECIDPSLTPLVPRMVHKYNPCHGGRKK